MRQKALLYIYPKRRSRSNEQEGQKERLVAEPSSKYGAHEGTFVKAIVCAKYGPVNAVKFEEVEKPSPSDDEVLVKVHASSVNFNILAHVSGKPFLARVGFGLLTPKHKIPGGDIAGRVEAVGGNVKQFRPGDEVFGEVDAYGYGAYAEYVCAPEQALAFKPANISFEEAGVIPQAALVALQGLRDKGQIQKGHRVLIYGASGGIGTFAVQIAKSFGAEVTGVCSARNLEMVHSIGADLVIDYTKEDFTKRGQSYDLILATAGYRSILDYRRALRPRGIYVATGGSMRGPKAMAQVYQALLLGPWISMAGSKKLRILTLRTNQKDLVFIKELVEAGKLRPVIDRRYALSEAAEAIRYYAEGHTQGKVAIAV
jgi:NADPH:quinone reductase-like Zn-dependent oxidoreductase